MAVPGLVYAQAETAPTGLLRAQKPVPNRYIVVLKDPGQDANAPATVAPTLNVASTARELTGLYSGELGVTYENALHGFAVSMTEDRALALTKDPRVAYVQEDSIVTVDTLQPSMTWGLDRIDQHQGRNLLYDVVFTGSTVHAYVIDSGILPTHPDFGNRAHIEADFVGDGHAGLDCDGHGTHVAGTIGGTNYGVAKEVSLHAVRVTNCSGLGFTSNVIAGVDWVTGNALRPAVANMSMSSEANAALDAAVRNSIAHGITYVVSGTNTGLDAGFSSPARVAEAITVGATDSTDTRPSFSGYGASLDVFAPGVDVVSDWNDGHIAMLSGTSMATPHVAGAAALYLQTHPAATPAMVSAAIVGQATKNVVQNPGPGSPNNFLYVVFPPATVTISGQEQHACRIDTNICGGTIFDAGTVTVTVNGRSYSTSYGKLSLAKNIAAALAAGINNDPDVFATASGSVINLLSRFGCYTVSATSSTSLPDYFNPSFTATVSGPTCP